jgi:glycosyltransferase involved in cell wall biosynthesis
MLNLAQGLAKRGYAVDLVVAQAEGAYLTEVPSSVQLVDLGNGRLVKGKRTLQRLPALVRYLRRQRPDAMISAMSHTNLVALWARQLAGVPMRLAVNEQVVISQDAPQASDRFFRLTPQLARYCYRWADCVVGVSQSVVDDLVQVVGIPKALVKVIYNPGVTPQLREKVQAPVTHPWFQPDQPPVFLAVGRLAKQKDFPTLLEAFARVRKVQRARLVILGEGPERPALEALAQKLGIEEDVSLPGFVENPYAYMARASTFVLSSRWEGLPTVLVEALFCGVPVISTDCPGGSREILRNGQMGCLVPTGDSVALSEAMVKALNGQIPRPPQESWQPYALETIVDQYVELLLKEQPSR